jgi:hypothetical protein
MDNLLKESAKQKIIQKLNEKGLKTNCPMCGNKKFIIADGFFNNPMQSELLEGLVLSGPSIPSIAIVCNNCGFISQHALGVLGLLNQPDKK